MGLPQAVGPYRIIASLGDEAASACVEHHLAIDTRGPARTLMLSVPSGGLAADASFCIRFRAEGEKSRRLPGVAAPPVLDVSPPHAVPAWVASHYAPAVPLRAAVTANGGSLPAETVCVLGSFLADVLAGAHASGLVHSGVLPANVVLAADAPRLLGFGSGRIAAGQEWRQSAMPQRSSAVGDGGPQQWHTPADDIQSLGHLLAFAATGAEHRTAGGADDVLRGVIDACLASDPGHRPQASTVAAQLRAGGIQNWLPPSVLQAIAEQQSWTSAREAEHAAISGEPSTDVPASPLESGPLTRRAVLVSGAAGLAGLSIGGAAAYATSGEDEPASRKPRRAGAPGTAPQPKWWHELPSYRRAEFNPALVWRNRIAMFPTRHGAVALDLRTGSERWSFDKMPVVGAMHDLGKGLILMPGKPFSAVAADTGEVKWTAEDYRAGSDLEFFSPVGLVDGTFLFIAKRGGSGADRYELVAYDIGTGQHRWRKPVDEPGDGQPIVSRKTVILPGKGGTYSAFDASRDGKRLWSQKYPGMNGSQETPLAPAGDLLVGTRGKELRAFRPQSSAPEWKVSADADTFGAAVSRSGTVFATDSDAVTYALGGKDGATKWKVQSTYQTTTYYALPPTALSTSGRTVLACNAAAVDAYEAGSGRPLWHFTPVRDPKRKGYAGMVVGQAKGLALVQNNEYVYALPVD